MKSIKLLLALLLNFSFYSYGQIEMGINLIGGVADNIKNASLTKDLRKAQKLFSLGKFEFLNINGDLKVEDRNLERYEGYLQKGVNRMVNTVKILHQENALGNIKPQIDIDKVNITIENTSESILHALRGENKVVISTGFIGQIMALSIFR